MKKINILKTLLVTTPIVSLAAPLTSCSEETINIVASQKTQFCHENKFSIQFELTRLTVKNVNVSIINEATGKIRIVNDSIDTFIESGVIDFEIDESLQEDTLLTFSIQFDVIHFGKTKSIVIDDFNIYYLPHQEEQKDDVEIEEKAIENVNSWKYDYLINFSAMPQSDVTIEIVNEETGLLSLPKNKYRVQDVKGYYKLPLSVDLNYSVTENKFIGFELHLNFKNSFGIEQDIYLTDLAVCFVRNHVEEVPLEYFDIEEQQTNGKTEFVCHGFKDELTKPILSEYSVISIPKGITKIEAEAFGDDRCTSFRKLNFASTVDTVETKAFAGCTHLIYIDLSVFDYEVIESWKNIFPGANQLFYQYGYVWISDKEYESESAYIIRSTVQDCLEKMGLASGWKSFFKRDVTPEDLFVLEDDKETGGKRLIGMKSSIWRDEEYRQRCLVVKIPDGVTKIDKYALSPLGESFARYNVKDDETETERSLILDDDLLELPEQCFYKTAMGGNILIPQKVTSIPKSCFEMMEFDSNGTPISYERLAVNIGTVDLRDNLNLTKIGARAFYDSNITCVYLGPNVVSVGEDAFSSCFFLYDFYFTSNATQEIENAFGRNMLALCYYLQHIYLDKFTEAPSWAKKPENSLFGDSGMSAGSHIVYVNSDMGIYDRALLFAALIENNSLPRNKWEVGTR